MLGRSTPKVSVCVLVYNHENYLKACLDSIIGQRCNFDFEVVVSDDASTDGSAKILETYSQRHPELFNVIYNDENLYSKGVKINPEINFPRCRGEYIAICEGDDFWMDQFKLQKQVEFLENNPEYVLSYGRLQCVDSESRIIQTSYKFPATDKSSFELSCATTVNTPSVVFRNKIGKWPSELRGDSYGDICFWSILSSYGAAKFQKELGPTSYRVHMDGVHSMASWSKIRQNHLNTLGLLLIYKWNKREYLAMLIIAKRMVGYFLRGEPRDKRKRFLGLW